MFREVRKVHGKTRETGIADAKRILSSTEYGVLTTVGPEGYPYGVPVNHLYTDDRLYFHCARQGHKLENIAHNDKVCFCAVENFKRFDRKMEPRKNYVYESAVVFGRARRIEDETQKAEILDAIWRRFFPSRTDELDRVRKKYAATAVVEIKIEHMTAKAAR